MIRTARLGGVSVGLSAALACSSPAVGVGCTEFAPIVCTTADPLFFYGVMFEQPLQFIDFETLPNGQPSVGGEQITPPFNYTHLGATFSAPNGLLRIGAPAPDQHQLVASAPSPVDHTWIRIDFSHPSLGAGIWFPGITTLRAYDARDALIASMTYSFSGGPWFMGVYSEIPIAYLTVDRGSNSERINDFIFNPVPEPATLALLGLAAAFPRRRR